MARDEAGDGSDVDLFFDCADPAFSLVELVRVRERIQGLLDAPVDVMTRDSLHPLLADRITVSAIRVFRWSCVPRFRR